MGRLSETEQWLAGPLSPDAWAGQVLISDCLDIFAFRFLSIPAFWTADYQSGGRASFAAERFAKWLTDWPKWWKSVGPKAPDNSYARLVWQMPEGGPEVTYEWAQTGKAEIVCRITNSNPADILLQGYVDRAHHQPRRSFVLQAALLAGKNLGAHKLAGLPGLQDLRMGPRSRPAGRIQRQDVSPAVARARGVLREFPGDYGRRVERFALQVGRAHGAHRRSRNSSM